MPIYEYRCDCGATEEQIRPYRARDDVATCSACGLEMKRLPPLVHCSPDGVYSYAPNVGDPDAFERRREAIKTGKKVIKAEAPRSQQEPGLAVRY